MSEAASQIHASALLIGRQAVLIRGRSGAGKSALTLALFDRVLAGGGLVRLIGDDRVMVEACHGRLVVRALPQMQGRIEVRGRGILALPGEPAGVVALVVDLDDSLPVRYPPTDELSAMILGIRLPRLTLWAEAPPRPEVVLGALAGSFDPQD